MSGSTKPKKPTSPKPKNRKENKSFGAKENALLTLLKPSGILAALLAVLNFALTTLGLITQFTFLLSIARNDWSDLGYFLFVVEILRFLLYYWIRTIQEPKIFYLTNATVIVLYLARLSNNIYSAGIVGVYTLILFGFSDFQFNVEKNYRSVYLRNSLAHFIVLLFHAQRSLFLISVSLRDSYLTFLTLTLVFLLIESLTIAFFRKTSTFLRLYHVLLLGCAILFYLTPNASGTEITIHDPASPPVLPDRGPDALNSTCLGGDFEIDASRGAQIGIFQTPRLVPAIACFTMSTYGAVKLSVKLQLSTGLDYDFVMLSRDVFDSSYIPQPFLFHQLDQTLSYFELFIWGTTSRKTIAAINTALWDIRSLIRNYNENGPFGETFYSVAPYYLGESLVKYVIEPCDASGAHANGKTLDEQVRYSIAHSNGCYQLRAQLKQGAKIGLLQDPTIPWDSTKYDFIGTLRLPCQTVLPNHVLQTVEFDRWNSDIKNHTCIWKTPDSPIPTKQANFTIFRCLEDHCEPALTGKAARIQYSNYSGVTLPQFDPNYVSPTKTLFERFFVEVSKVPSLHFALVEFGAFLTGLWQSFTSKFVEDKYDETEALLKLFHDYAKEYYNQGLDLAHHWHEDSIFADQFLNGINPIMLKNASHCTLPRGFDFRQNETIVKEITNFTYTELKTQHRLYFVDYEVLLTLPPHPGSTYYSPIVVFYLSQDNRLLPLCIQLTRNSWNTIYWAQKRKTISRDWLLAKMYVMNADSQYHEMVSHLLLTHLALEPISVAQRRRLSNHTLGALMSLHLEGTEAINTLGRVTLLKENGDFEQLSSVGLWAAEKLMEKVYVNGFQIPQDLNFPRLMEERGFPRAHKFPHYHYRDDGFLLWDALSDFVDNVVDDFYPTEKDLEEDNIIQGFFCDLRQDANVHGLPETWTRKNLKDFLTATIFTGSVQHAAVNDGQLDFYGWIPNRPFLMKQGMPEKETKTEDWMKNALANPQEAKDTVKLARTLSAKIQRKTLLNMRTKDHPFPKQYSKLKERLTEIEKTIKKRGKYLYLLPSSIAVSIAV